MQTLVLSVKELRTQFAYLTEKVQSMAVAPKATEKSEAEIDKERELQATTAKVTPRRTPVWIHADTHHVGDANVDSQSQAVLDSHPRGFCQHPEGKHNHHDMLAWFESVTLVSTGCHYSRCVLRAATAPAGGDGVELYVHGVHAGGQRQL
eukprot:6506225-Pyramimonas_sp.AAC.1